MTDDDLRQAGHLIRAYLEPLWNRFHEADLKWSRIKRVPSIASTAMCVHTSHFTKRLLKDLGQDGWQVTSGWILPESMLHRPDYMMPDMNRVYHWWLEHSELGAFDLTADQFGFGEVLVGQPGSVSFRNHLVHRKPQSTGSVTGTMRNWEGDARGSWWGHEEQRAAYEQLQDDVRAALGMGVEPEIEESTTLGM